MENIVYLFLRIILLLLSGWQETVNTWASVTNAISAMIAALAAVGALYYAWKGFKKIEGELVDQRDQINELTKVAKELKDQNNISREIIRYNAMPQFRI